MVGRSLKLKQRLRREKAKLKRRIRREKQKSREEQRKQRSLVTKDENEDNNHSHDGIPSDIIMYGILTRVPVESLIRFRCVCKQWNNLTLDPLFIDLLSYRTPGFIFLVDSHNKSYGFEYININTKRRRNIGSLIPYSNCDEYVKILCSLNGLLLLSKSNLSKAYLVYNPITGCCSKSLPEISIEQVHECHLFLAYDSIIAKYKVVCFIHSLDSDDNDVFFCKILTLGVDNSWRDVVIPKLDRDYYLLLGECPEPVLANGSLHVMMDMLDGSYRILSLDVSGEAFYTTSLPKHNDVRYSDLLEMGGLLCFVQRVSITKFKLWVSEINSDKHEWMGKYQIDLRHLKGSKWLVPGSLNQCKLVAIHGNLESFKLILTNEYKSRVHYYSYDTKRKQLDYIFEEYWSTPLYYHVNTLAYW